jgi:glutathione peroxidase
MSQLLVLFVLGGVAVMVVSSAVAADKPEKKTPPALNFTMNSLAGKPVDLSKCEGKVVLIVNVASECGLTPQYEGLQALYEKFGKDGLVVLGVPCHQFGAQEPGTSAEIAQFCKANYGVTFDMLAKVEVDGAGACGLYKHLTSQKTTPQGPGKITWNFEKFLLNRKGEVVNRFDPNTEPDAPALIKAIEAALSAK